MTRPLRSTVTYNKRLFSPQQPSPRNFYWSSRRRQNKFGDVDLGDWHGGNRKRQRGTRSGC